MVKQIEKARDKGEQIPIMRLTFGVVWNMLSNSLYSEDMFDDLNSKDVDEMEGHIDNIFGNVGRFNLSDFFKFLKPFDLQGIRKSIKLSYDHLHACLDNVMDHRRRERDSGVSRTQDFLDLLLDLCQEKGNHELTYQDTKLILAELFIAGTDTPSAIVEWAMAEVLHNPKNHGQGKTRNFCQFWKI
ncbi:hypothetical protein Leryth_001680 [Lithospermum erythrorhizon]|nr:hypothetical protein Leryth_001680 [Lithospermum erythrorhizon]